MPTPTATILGTNTANAQRMTRAKTAEMNPSGNLIRNAFLNRQPAFYYYIFNVSEMEHRVSRPWAHPDVIIPARAANERYSKPFIIPDIVVETRPRVGSFDMGIDGTDGAFLAQDALNPDMPNGDWRNHRPLNAGMAGNEGTDLYNFGCWWTVNNPPTEEEILAAEASWDNYCNSLIEQATQLSLQGEKGMPFITKTMHVAANHFGITATWHQRFTAKIECPGCGEQIPASINRHMPKDKCGFVLNWEGALRGGQATKAEAVEAGVLAPEVPEETASRKK